MSIQNPSPIDLIKGNITITEVLNRYVGLGIIDRGRKSVNIKCLVHQESKASMSIYFNSNIAFCHSCKSRLDVLDIVQLSLKANKKDAIKQLLKDYGLGSNSLSDEIRLKLQQDREQKEVERVVRLKLKQTQEIISASRSSLNRLIRSEEDLLTWGGYYHHIDYYLNLEDTLSNGTFEQKKRAIAGTLDSGRR